MFTKSSIEIGGPSGRLGSSCRTGAPAALELASGLVTNDAASLCVAQEQMRRKDGTLHGSGSCGQLTIASPTAFHKSPLPGL